MAKGSTYEGDLLKLGLCGLPISSWAATAGTTVLWCALHDADPSSGTGQNQSEISLTGYARVAKDRSTGSSGFTVSGSGPATASPNATISFPQLTSTSTDTATFWSVGHSSSGTGKIYYSGAISPTLTLGANVTPQITTGSSITEL